ncbi:hypothetical protein [Phenylobacterium aquaticum]|uniref:hypothetical protein n=1 Tax=Phenylobacterium aquaticum TaxID=1763816 RepID=UPI0026F33070|nr:hypothetical protein [Phenylobacterium aquaticum]
MTAILYPLATTPDAALSAPLGRAAREREAQALAGEPVAFVSGPAGPAYASREAALDALAGRIEDDRPGRLVQVAVEDRFCRLVEVATTRRAPPPVATINRDGRRWPTPPVAPPTVWRLSVSYWRPVSAAPAAGAPDVDHPQARRARRLKQTEAEPETLKAMSRQPLRAFKPQQPLDIGLFEVRLPENPDLVMPDE